MRLGHAPPSCNGSLSSAPGHDELEVSIFGPGKGESCVVHLGGGDWIIVDSCVDQRTNVNAPLNYLRSLEVDLTTKVHLVVGTHAHDDHIAGIADCFEACTAARFVCSSALTGDEFQALIGDDKRLRGVVRRSSYKEYERVFELVKTRGLLGGLSRVRRATWDLMIYERAPQGILVGASVKALSPSDQATTRALIALADAVPRPGAPLRAKRIDPNDCAVALWVEVGDHAILLGADLLIGPASCGWSSVLAWFAPERSASIFKVPHHGSKNAHHDDVWSRFLSSQPVALIAPYRQSHLPTEDDQTRLRSLTPKAYLTASPRLPTAPTNVKATARKFRGVARSVYDPWGSVGHVRARTSLYGQGDWTVEIFPPARQL